MNGFVLAALLSAYVPSASAAAVDTKAIGLVEIFPFKDSKNVIRCTAFHIGNGLMVSAGHCFLGSYGCNGARVRFGATDIFATRNTSACTKVLYNSATKDGQDVVVFKIDNPPRSALQLATLPAPSQQTSIYGYSQKSILEKNNNCVVTNAPVVDPFGRVRNLLGTVSAGCTMGAYSHGAPVLDTSGKVIGIYEAPVFRTSTSVATSFIKSLLWLDAALPGLESPQKIHAGGFLPEAFPYALADELKLEMISMDEYPAGKSAIAARFVLSPGATMTVSDATHGDMKISGLQNETSRQFVPLHPPFKIFLQTAKNSFAINDSVEFETH